MLIHVGGDRSQGIDLGLAGTMAGVAGALNAVGFLVAGSFTANMTGNVSAFADEIVDGSVVIAAAFLSLVCTFIIGATVASVMIRQGEHRNIRAIYALAIIVEASILLGLGIVLIFPEPGKDMLLVTVLSFVMGFQNAVTTTLSNARVRSTHISGMATDIGIELAAMVDGVDARDKALPKLKLHGLTLISFTSGGVGGAVMFSAVQNWFFVIAAAILFLISVPEAFRAGN